jgi:pimeloyl-ACP methyl ester carboxylesterase
MTLASVSRQHADWYVVESQPPHVKARLLCLPGLLCTDVIYEPLLKSTALREAGIQIVAANPPGFKGLGTSPQFDFSVESYAASLRDLLNREHVTAIVGHSISANFVLELLKMGPRAEKIVLLSPTFRRASEPWDLRLFDAVARYRWLRKPVGKLVYQLLPFVFAPYFTDVRPQHLRRIVDEGRLSPLENAARQLNGFFDYLDRHANTLDCLSAIRQPVWIIRGARDNVRLFDDDRARLQKLPHVTFQELPIANHFPMVDAPDALAQQLIEMANS